MILMVDIDMAAKLADVKEDLYRVTVGLTALIETLAEKGYLSREELILQARKIELELMDSPIFHGEP